MDNEFGTGNEWEGLGDGMQPGWDTTGTDSRSEDEIAFAQIQRLLDRGGRGALQSLLETNGGGGVSPLRQGQPPGLPMAEHQHAQLLERLRQQSLQLEQQERDGQTAAAVTAAVDNERKRVASGGAGGGGYTKKQATCGSLEREAARGEFLGFGAGNDSNLGAHADTRQRYASGLQQLQSGLQHKNASKIGESTFPVVVQLYKVGDKVEGSLPKIDRIHTAMTASGQSMPREVVQDVDALWKDMVQASVEVKLGMDYTQNAFLGSNACEETAQESYRQLSGPKNLTSDEWDKAMKDNRVAKKEEKKGATGGGGNGNGGGGNGGGGNVNGGGNSGGGGGGGNRNSRQQQAQQQQQQQGQRGAQQWGPPPQQGQWGPPMQGAPQPMPPPGWGPPQGPPPGQMQQQQQQRPQQQQTGPHNNGPIQCFYCQGPHLKRNCPVLPKP